MKAIDPLKVSAEVARIKLERARAEYLAALDELEDAMEVWTPCETSAQDMAANFHCRGVLEAALHRAHRE